MYTHTLVHRPRPRGCQPSPLMAPGLSFIGSPDPLQAFLSSQIYGNSSTLLAAICALYCPQKDFYICYIIGSSQVHCQVPKGSFCCLFYRWKKRFREVYGLSKVTQLVNGRVRTKSRSSDSKGFPSCHAA